MLRKKMVTTLKMMMTKTTTMMRTMMTTTMMMKGTMMQFKRLFSLPMVLQFSQLMMRMMTTMMMMTTTMMMMTTTTLTMRSLILGTLSAPLLLLKKRWMPLISSLTRMVTKTLMKKTRMMTMTTMTMVMVGRLRPHRNAKDLAKKMTLVKVMETTMKDLPSGKGLGPNGLWLLVMEECRWRLDPSACKSIPLSLSSLYYDHHHGSLLHFVA